MPVIDRAFIELVSNAPDVEKGFTGLIRTMGGATEATKKAQDEALKLANTHSALERQIERVRAKQEELTQKINSGTLSEGELAEARRKQQALLSSLERLEEKAIQSKEKLDLASKKLQKTTEDTGSTFRATGAVISDFAANPLATAQSGLEAIAAKAGPAAVAVLGVSAAAVTAGAAIFGFVSSAAAAVEQLEILSSSTGLTTQELQALDRIGKEAGLESLNLGKSLGALNKQMASGEGGKLVQVLGMLGGSIRDEQGNIKGIIPVLDDLQARLNSIPDPAERARVAALAFSEKGLREMGRLLLSLDKPLSSHVKTMVDVGVTYDNATKGALKRFDDMLDRVGRRWEAVKIGIVRATLALSDFTTKGGFAGLAFGSSSAANSVAGTDVPTAAAPAATGGGGDQVRAFEAVEARARGIASGKTGQALDLALKLEAAEKKLADAIKEGSAERTIQAANEVAAIKQQIKALDEFEQRMERLLRLQDEFFRKGGTASSAAAAALIAGEATAGMETSAVGKSLGEILAPGVKKGKEFQSDLDYLSGEGAMARLKKDSDDIAKYAMDKSRESHTAFQGLAKDSAKAAKAEWGKSIDSIRDGAGRIFDAMLTKGKGTFQSLADFFESLFQTALRKIFQNLAQMIFAPGSSKGGLAGIFAGVFPGLGGGGSGGGGGGGFSIPGLSGGLGSKGGSHLQDIAAGGSGKPSAAASLGNAGLMLGGSMLLGDALKQGGVRGMVEGAAGGAAVGFSVGGPIGAAIGAAAGFVAGMFGGGEKRRAKERQARLDIQSNYMSDIPSTISTSGVFGMGGNFDVETDLVGRARAFRSSGAARGKGINVEKVEIKLLDGRHADEAADVFLKKVRGWALQGPLGDDI